MRMYSTGTPMRVADLLAVDGGWWATPAVEAELLERFGTPTETTRRALIRLAKRGVLRVRQVDANRRVAFEYASTGCTCELYGWCPTCR